MFQPWDDTAYTGATSECLDRGSASREIPDRRRSPGPRRALPRNEILEKSTERLRALIMGVSDCLPCQEGELASARVWVDRRDGRGWIVEKRQEVVDWGDPTTQPPMAIEKPFLRFCRPLEDYSVEITPPDTPLDAFTTGQLSELFDRAKARRAFRAMHASSYGGPTP